VKRITLPGIVDIVLIDDGGQMRWLNDHPKVTRALSARASLLHQLLNHRMTDDLRFRAGVLPVFIVREDEARRQRRAQLESQLDALAGAPSSQTQPLVRYVAGHDAGRELEVAVQQWCGRLFRADYAATLESARAGLRIARWPALDPIRAAFFRKTGRLASDKRLLEQAAAGDLHCVHATSIGMANIVHGLQAMRRWAREPISARWSTRTTVLRSLSAPPAAVRGCSGEVAVPFLDRPLTARSLIVFRLRSMYERSLDTDDAFMAGGWSACPARRAVLDMLAEVWEAACVPEHTDGHETTALDSARAPDRRLPRSMPARVADVR
jgi:hypothetical protein